LPDLFSGIDRLTHRKMKGGLRLDADGTIFAIIDADRSIWLKGADAMQDRLQAEG